jgi:hypothetical protein
MTLMGISITNGMIATNLSAFFLLMCMITFFTGFGTFIIMTIFYSWLSAFFILCPALMFFGPEGNTGEISFLKALVASLFASGEPASGKPANVNIHHATSMSVPVQTTESMTLPSIFPSEALTPQNVRDDKVVAVYDGRADAGCVMCGFQACVPTPTNGNGARY